MAQIACDFVRLIGEIRLLSSSFGLGGHFWKNQYWFSAVSLIFIEPGTSWRVDFSPPRSDISRYAPVFFPLRIDDFNCFLLRNPMNFNCFFRHFNCVNTQIRSLIRVLLYVLTPEGDTGFSHPQILGVRFYSILFCSIFLFFFQKFFRIFFFAY